MAWCVMAPSHYLNQCWLIRNAQDNYRNMSLKITYFWDYWRISHGPMSLYCLKGGLVKTNFLCFHFIQYLESLKHCFPVNSIAPQGKCGNNLLVYFSNSFYEMISWELRTFGFRWECYRNPLIVRPDWFRWVWFYVSKFWPRSFVTGWHH